MRSVLNRFFFGLVMFVATATPAWAQAPGGQVSYRPVAFMPVPALSGIAMILLAGLLILVAWRLGRSGQWMKRVSSVVILVATAAISLTVGMKNIHAIAVQSTVLIQGSECSTETTESYDPFATSASLTSECGIQVEVTAIEFAADCTPAGLGTGACEVGTSLNNGDSCDLPVCEAQTPTSACQGGAVKLSTSPGGDMVVCDDPVNATCEQDMETLCPVGWQLCSYQQHVARNDGWTYPLTPAGNIVVGEIYCRAGSGAGHFTLGTFESPANLGVDIPQNCHYGSSRPSCTATYGCNEKNVQALCCLSSPTCGNGIVDSPEEQCDDGNQDESDACLNSCTFRVGSGPGC